MSSSHAVFMAPPINAERGSHFMRLPTEIREMIYRYLLISKYTIREHNMTSREYDRNRSSIRNGPDQTYQFDTAILGTNRRIHEEARDLCRRENDFVCLTSMRPSCLGQKLEKSGLQIIAKCSEARDFWNTSITLTLDSATCGGWPQADAVFRETGGDVDASHGGQPWNYVFCSEELPNFCRLLLRMSRYDHSILRQTALYLDINPAIGHEKATDLDKSSAGLSRMRRLLDPLRQLHSLGAAQIQGPLSGRYKGEIIASVCKDCPTAVDLVQASMVSLEQADKHAGKGRRLQANLEYKAIINRISSCCWLYDERDFVMDNGPFPGLTAEQNINNLVVRLQARIAAAYLELGQLRMARVYTERALDPRRDYDDRHNKLYSISVEPWEGAVYAEALHVAAQIRFIHGNVWEAKVLLKSAGALLPLNEGQESIYVAWKNHARSLRDRNNKREEARKVQKQKEDEKTEGIEIPAKPPTEEGLTPLFAEMFLVACNWKNKADRLLRGGISDLAAKKYKTVFSKLDSISQNRRTFFDISSGMFESYFCDDAINALKFKVQACIAAAYLNSRKYKDASNSSDAALECNLSNHYDCSHTYYRELQRDWMEDQKLDYLRLHYCKGVALNFLGDTVSAVKHMKQAYRRDPGHAAVCAQLVLLSEKLKLKLEYDKNREERRKKLNSQQTKLYKKQTKRREKA